MSVYIYKTQNNQKDEIVLEEHEEIIDFIDSWFRNQVCAVSDRDAEQVKNHLFSSKLLDKLESDCWDAMGQKEYAIVIWNTPAWFIQNEEDLCGYYNTMLRIIFAIKKLRKAYGSDWEHAKFIFESDIAE